MADEGAQSAPSTTLPSQPAGPGADAGAISGSQLFGAQAFAPGGDPNPSGGQGLVSGSQLFPQAFGGGQAAPAQPAVSGAASGKQLFGAQAFSGPSGMPGNLNGPTAPDTKQGSQALQAYNASMNEADKAVQDSGDPLALPGKTQALDLKFSDLPDVIKTPAQAIMRGVGNLSQAISYPLRLGLYVDVAAAAAVGSPLAQALKEKMDGDPSNWRPGKSNILPGPQFADVSDFTWDKASELAQANNAGPMVRDAISVGKGISNAVVSVATDPLWQLKFGQLSSSAVELQKVGRFGEGADGLAAATARDPLQFQSFSAKSATPIISNQQMIDGYNALKESPPAQAISSLVDKITATGPGRAAADLANKYSPVSLAGKLARYLSPDTGFADVDSAVNTHNGLSQGQDNNALQAYKKIIQGRNYTQGEASVVREAGEQVGNLSSGLSPEIQAAAKPGLFTSEMDLRAQLAQKIPGIAKDMGIVLPEGRAEAIAEGVIDAKKVNSANLGRSIQAGDVTADNINDKVLPNYMPHVRNPIYNSSSEADAIEKAYNPSSAISGRDVMSKQRKMQGTITEINARILADHGKPDFFMPDPFQATAINAKKSMQMVRDRNLLSVVANHAVPDSAEARAAGYLPIQHPYFEGKTIAIPGAVSTDLGRVVKQASPVFPGIIADKISYYLGTKMPGGFTGGLAAMTDALEKTPIALQNRALRMQVFTSPMIWVRNGLSNLMKGLAFGTGIDSAKATGQLLLSEGPAGKMMSSLPEIEAAPNLLNPKGKTYSGQQILNDMRDRGVLGDGSTFREGMGDWMGTSKKALLDQSGSSAAKYAQKAFSFADGAMNAVARFGEKGEDFTRANLYIQKIMEGYEPDMAANLVNRVMFDYTRNSPLTDAARFFSPFIQHPIKLALFTPELIGRAPGLYSALMNTFPKVLSNALSDPMDQVAFNQTAPDYIKSRNPVIGPLIGADSWMTHVFGKPNPNSQTRAYFTPDVGIEIINNLVNPSLNPMFSALLHHINGQDEYGTATKDGKRSWNSTEWEIARGSVAMPNTVKFAKQILGLGDPQYYEPKTTLALKAMTSQAGGEVDMTSDAHKKLVSLAIMDMDLTKSAMKSLAQKQGGLGAGSSYNLYNDRKDSKEGPILPSTNAEIYFDAKQSMLIDHNNRQEEIQKTQAAQQYLQGEFGPDEYKARLLNLHQTIQKANQAVQFAVGRTLEMMKGARSPEEARKMGGVQLSPPRTPPQGQSGQAGNPAGQVGQ